MATNRYIVYFVEKQSKHPRLWTFLYLLMVATFTRYNVKFYSEHGRHLETVTRLLNQHNVAAGRV